MPNGRVLSWIYIPRWAPVTQNPFVPDHAAEHIFATSQVGNSCYAQWVAPGTLYASSPLSGPTLGDGSTITLPQQGYLSNLEVVGDVNTTGSGETFVVYLNGNPTALSTTVTSGHSSAINTSALIACAAGDTLSLLYKAPSAQHFNFINISFTFTPS